LVLIAHPQAIKKAPINGTFFIGWRALVIHGIKLGLAIYFLIK
jgi:hypothetical protein